MRLKVLAIIPSGFCFGLQNAELALFSQVVSRVEGHFLTTRWNDGEFNRRLDALRLPSSSTWLGMFSRRLDRTNLMMTAECLLKLPIAWRDLWKLYRSFRPDIVYVANHHELILLLPLLFWIRRKVVCHMHDPPPAIGFQKLSFFFWRRGVGHFLFISHNVRERLAKLGPLKPSDIVVHNGIQMSELVIPRERGERFLKDFKWPDDSIIFGMSGQLSAHKGHEDFVEAAAIALRNNSRLRFVIGGRGQDNFAFRLRQLIHGHGLGDYVKLCGWLPHSSEFYEAIDVLVLASRHDEGFGLVIAEAGERGLPTIATPSGGAVEVLTNEETGILVDKRNPQAIADAMVRLANDANLRRKMGQRARHRVINEFNLAVQGDRFADFLEQAARESTN